MTDSFTAGLFPRIAVPDHLAKERTRAALTATPRGLSLGRLIDVASQVAAWQSHVPPAPIDRVRVVIFAGDHGIAHHGISAYTPQTTVEQFDELQAGAGPTHVMARATGASIRLVDISLDHEAWGDERVSRSTPPIDTTDALDDDQFHRALAIGQQIADQEVDAGADLLVPGNLGVGTTTVAAGVVGVLTRTEPVAIVRPSSGTTDEIWKHKVTVLRDAMFRARGLAGSIPDLLTSISGPDFVALVGFIGQAAARRTPVLLDGASITAAALVANRLTPGARDWFIAGQLTPEPAQLIALTELDLTPLVALEMSTGQGCAALTALPIIQAAVALAGEEIASHE